MRTATSRAKDDFLQQVADGLADLTEEDREEVLQDLRAHLAELTEDEIPDQLGTPESFVAEFRSSAGLSDHNVGTVRGSLATARARLDELSRQLAEVSRWHAIRPLWVWTRGWLLVSSLAVLSGGTVFRRFPIPTFDGSTVIGLGLVVAATLVSLWLARRDTGVRQVGSVVYGTVVVLLVASNILWARDVSRTSVFEGEIGFSEQLTSADGYPIHNIHAYDLEGNPVDVLLYDQEGRPILSLPHWVYEEAEHFPGHGPYDYGLGLVTLPRDDLGRPITNLYPLELFEYSGEQIPPPSLGFPRSTERDDAVANTTLPVPLD